jgi:hypothetical protein
MNSVRSAFKNKNQKSYGNVDKMYIHFYTIPTHASTSSENSGDLNIYWYDSPTENTNLFNDFHTLLKKMKQYTNTQYTGDLFSINSLQQFKESLILLGVKDVANPSEVLKINLQDGTTINMNLHTVNNVPHFNDMFDICFQNYDFHQSFSDENDTTTTELNDTHWQLICVENAFTYSNFYLHTVELNTIAFKKINSSIDVFTLNGWFNTLVKNKQYTSAIKFLNTLTDFNKDLEVINITEEDIEDGASINESVSTAKISKTDWIKLFCDLYIQEDNITDILLSDVYQEYVTASGWSDTPIVTMAIFIKQLRSLNKYTIKRRSKGMMLIGHTSLVSSQAEFKKMLLNGSLSSRSLFKYQHPNEVRKIIISNEQKIKNIGHPYAREVVFLLNNTGLILDYQTVSQFCSIPQLRSELEKISSYINKNLDDEQVKFEASKGNIFLNFRKTADECLIYFPFNKKYYDYSFKTDGLMNGKSYPENTSQLKDNDELTFYEFGNYGNNSYSGVDLNWTDSFGPASKAKVGNITSTRTDTTIHRVFKTAKPVPNQQLRKDPQESEIDSILNAMYTTEYTTDST